MSLDVEKIQQEIETLRGKRDVAAERIQLYSQRGRGRGRGRGFPGGRGFQDGRPAYEGRHHEGRYDRDDRAEEKEPQTRRIGEGLSAGLQARLGPRQDAAERRPFASNDEHDHRVGRASWKRRMDNSFNIDEEEQAEPSNAEPLPGSNTSRLASAVVTDASQPVGGPSQRPLENGSANPETKKRNKRLFGSLLGTLQKFQEEDQKFKRSRLAQNRAEAENRAATQAVLDEQKMKDKHRQDLAKARVAEINTKKELEHQLQAKEYEVLMAKKLTQDMKLSGWLRTITEPPLLWLPRHHTENTRLLLAQRCMELEAWQEGEVLKIEKVKQEIMDRFRPVPQPLLRPSKYTLEYAAMETTENAEAQEAVDDRFAGDDAPMEAEEDQAEVKEEDVKMEED